MDCFIAARLAMMGRYAESVISRVEPAELSLSCDSMNAGYCKTIVLKNLKRS